ncbi:MAG TPA: SPFH domain-containing protein [Planctomycetota bacterium]|nr:SPFH domain-containing protein [Planctomycetota bacterium]
MARGFGESESFWARYGSKSIAWAVGAGLFIILLIAGISSCATTATNTEVAIVVNNVTGGTSLLQNGGMVLHLPFGLSSVYKIDKSQRVLPLTATHRTKENPEGDHVNIKTNDGSSVAMDVEVVYQLDSGRAAEVFRELGPEENIEDILRGITRSEIRSQLGELSTLEIAEARHRKVKLDLTEKRLKEYMDQFGIQVVSINAQNFRFDAEYDKIIRERKEADQILTNQKDYQEAAIEEGKRKTAEAQRDKESALAQLKGDLNKSLLAAQGDATRIVTRAEQQAYQLEREGEIGLKNAEQESAALLAEGQRKAEAMEKLFAAYQSGGEGLVKEQLMQLYNGVTVRARPYSASERIDQIQTINMRAQALQPPAAPAPAPAEKGGR